MENQPKPVKELTYNQAIGELDSILRTMQSDSCDIDKLTAYTRRATELLRECRSRLTATDEELRSILEGLGKQLTATIRQLKQRTICGRTSLLEQTPISPTATTMYDENLLQIYADSFRDNWDLLRPSATILQAKH